VSILDIITILIVLSALFSYVNHRYIRLPTTIGVMLIALVISLAMILIDAAGANIREPARTLLEQVDFDEALLHGMLGFLLFAGALHINLNDLAQQKWIISSLATVGVIVSTFLVAGMTYVLLKVLGVGIDFQYCLLFGALISPTDPIAVLGILKTAGAPKSLETKITGESLFNDGVGVVVFVVLLELVRHPHDVTAGHVVLVFLEEAVGGVLFGLAIGWLAYLLLKKVNNYQVEVLLTLALVMGGYRLATMIHTSGPIAIVVAGLLIGNHGRRLAMSETTCEHLDTFWELVDEILNAVLFVLIGLEILIILEPESYKTAYLAAGVLAIPVVLLARFISVGGAVTALRTRRSFSPGVISILTWGGLRGGISVALALSIDKQWPERNEILVITYAIVVFSILVQGLTISKVVRRAVAAQPNEEAGAT